MDAYSSSTIKHFMKRWRGVLNRKQNKEIHLYIHIIAKSKYFNIKTSLISAYQNICRVKILYHTISVYIVKNCHLLSWLLLMNFQLF